MTPSPRRNPSARPHALRRLAGPAIACLALALAGCASPTLRTALAPDPLKPSISVVRGDVIVVNQEPTVLPAGNSRVVYELPAAGGLSFVGGGIVVEGEVLSVTPAEGPNTAQRASANRQDTKPAAFTTRLRKDVSDTVRCETESPLRVVCAFSNARSGAVFLYTVRLARDGKELPPLDPSWRIK